MSDIFLLPFNLKSFHLSGIRLILQICKIYLYKDNKFNMSTSYTQRQTNKQTTNQPNKQTNKQTAAAAATTTLTTATTTTTKTLAEICISTRSYFHLIYNYLIHAGMCPRARVFVCTCVHVCSDHCFGSLDLCMLTYHTDVTVIVLHCSLRKHTGRVRFGVQFALKKRMTQRA